MPRRKIIRTFEEEEKYQRNKREKKEKFQAKRRKTKRMLTKKDCQLLSNTSPIYSNNITQTSTNLKKMTVIGFQTN